MREEEVGVLVSEIEGRWRAKPFPVIDTFVVELFIQFAADQLIRRFVIQWFIFTDDHCALLVVVERHGDS